MTGIAILPPHTSDALNIDHGGSSSSLGLDHGDNFEFAMMSESSRPRSASSSGSAGSHSQRKESPRTDGADVALQNRTPSTSDSIRSPSQQQPPLLMTTMPSSTGHQSLAAAAAAADDAAESGHSSPETSKKGSLRLRNSSATHSSTTTTTGPPKLSPRMPSSSSQPWSTAKVRDWTRKPSDWSSHSPSFLALRAQNTGPERNFSSAIMSHKTQFPASSRYFLTVIPPDDLPCEPPHPRSVAGSSSFSHMRRGALLPLYPTLNGQLYAISREYGLPSIGGLAIYLCEDSDGNLGPRIGESTWQILWSRYFAEDEDFSSAEWNGPPMPAPHHQAFSPRPASRSQSRAGTHAPFAPFDPEATPGGGRRTPSGNALDGAGGGGHLRRATGGSAASYRGSPAFGQTDLDGSFNSGRPSSRMSSSLPIVGRVEWTVEKHKAPWWPSWVGETDVPSSTRSSSDSVTVRKRVQHNKQRSMHLFKRMEAATGGSAREPGADGSSTQKVSDGAQMPSALSSDSLNSIIEKSHPSPPVEEEDDDGHDAQPHVRTDSQDTGVSSDQQASARSSRVRSGFGSGTDERLSFSSSRRAQEQQRRSGSGSRVASQGYHQLDENEEDGVVGGDEAAGAPSRPVSSAGRSSKSRHTGKSSRHSQAPRPADNQQYLAAAPHSMAGESSSFAGYSALLDYDDAPLRRASNAPSGGDFADRRQTMHSEIPSEYSKYSALQRNTLEMVPDSDESIWRALRDAPQPPGTSGFGLSRDRLSSHRSEDKRSHYSNPQSNDPKDSISQWLSHTQFSPDLMRRRSALVQEDIPDHVELSDDREEAGDEEEEDLLPPQDDVRDVVQLWADQAAAPIPAQQQQLAPATSNIQKASSPSLDTPMQTPQTKLLSPIALGNAGMFDGPAPQLGSLSRGASAQPSDDDDDVDDDVEDALQHERTPHATTTATRGLLQTNDDRLQGMTSSVDSNSSSLSRSLNLPRSPGEASQQSGSTEVSGLEDFERALELLSPVASQFGNSPSLAHIGRRADGRRMTSRDSLAAAKSLSTSVTPSPRWLSKNRTPRAGSSATRGGAATTDMYEGRPKSTSAAGDSPSGGARALGFVSAESGQWPPASSGRLADQVMKALSPVPPSNGFQPSPLRRRHDASIDTGMEPSESADSPSFGTGVGGHTREASGTTASEYNDDEEGVEARKDQRRQVAHDALHGYHSHSSSSAQLRDITGRDEADAGKFHEEEEEEEEAREELLPHDGSVLIHPSSGGLSRSTSASDVPYDYSIDEQAYQTHSSFGDEAEETLRETQQERPTEQAAIHPADRESIVSSSVSDSHFWRKPQDHEEAIDRAEDVMGEDLPEQEEQTARIERASRANGQDNLDREAVFSAPAAPSSDALGSSAEPVPGTLMPSTPPGAVSGSEGDPPSVVRLIRGQSFSESSVAPSSAAQTPDAGESYSFVLSPRQDDDDDDGGQEVHEAFDRDQSAGAFGDGSGDGQDTPSWLSQNGRREEDENPDDDERSEAHTLQQHARQSRGASTDDDNKTIELRASVPSTLPTAHANAQQYVDDQSDYWSQDGSRYSRIDDRQSLFGTRSASNSAFSRFEDSGPETPTFFFDQQLTDSRPNSYRVSKRVSNGSSMPSRSPLGVGATVPASVVSVGSEGGQGEMGLGLFPSPMDGGPQVERLDPTLAKSTGLDEDVEVEGEGDLDGGASNDVAVELDAMLSSIDAFNDTEKSRPWSRPNSRASTAGRKFGDQRSLTLPDLSGHEDIESMTMSTREAVRQALTGSERMRPEQVPSRLSLGSTKSLGNYETGSRGSGAAGSRRSTSPRRASSSSASGRLGTSAQRQSSHDSYKSERGFPPRSSSLSGASTSTSPHGRFRALPPSPSLIPNNLANGMRAGEPMSPLAPNFLSSGSPLSGGTGNLFSAAAVDAAAATAAAPASTSSGHAAAAHATQSPRMVTSPSLAPAASGMPSKSPFNFSSTWA